VSPVDCAVDDSVLRSSHFMILLTSKIKPTCRVVFATDLMTVLTSKLVALLMSQILAL
jgi:hypothetical protein